MKLCFQADTLGAAGECMALDSTGLGVTHPVLVKDTTTTTTYSHQSRG